MKKILLLISLIGAIYLGIDYQDSHNPLNLSEEKEPSVIDSLSPDIS